MRMTHRIRRYACVLLTCALTSALTVSLGAGPAQASTGEAMVAAENLTQGSAGLYYEWQTFGSTTWNKELVVAGNFWSQPALSIQSNGNVLIAASNEDTGTLYFFWQGYQTTAWNIEQVSAVGETFAAPSMAVQKVPASGQPAYVAIVAENPDTSPTTNPSFTYYYSQIGKAGWYSESLPGGYDGQTSPDVTVGSNNEIAVVFDPGIFSLSASGFFIDAQTYLSTSWTSVHVTTGYIENNPQVEIQSSGNIVIADSVGSQGSFKGTEFYWSPANDLLSWNAENISTTMGEVGEGGDIMADNPAAGSITITGDGNGSCFSAMTQDYGPNPWTTAQVGCPGDYGGSPQIAAEASGELIATSQGTNSGPGYFYWAAKGSTTWHTESLPGLTYLYGQIAVASYTP
jgi:hypothetical protein